MWVQTEGKGFISWTSGLRENENPQWKSPDYENAPCREKEKQWAVPYVAVHFSQGENNSNFHQSSTRNYPSLSLPRIILAFLCLVFWLFWLVISDLRLTLLETPKRSFFNTSSSDCQDVYMCYNGTPILRLPNLRLFPSRPFFLRLATLLFQTVHILCKITPILSLRPF